MVGVLGRKRKPDTRAIYGDIVLEGTVDKQGLRSN